MSPRTTDAVLIERPGRPEVLVGRAVELPGPGPGEVHLRVAAAGLNFADLIMRAGLYGTVPPYPFSPGFEVEGVLEGVGRDVRGWKEGDRAVAIMRYGGYARDVVVPAANLFRPPAGLTPVEAASVPVAFLTAWVCLFESARAREGETVLVLGAAGGVGTAAVQLALDAGLRVVGTAGSERKRRFVTDELGAEACFDSGGGWEDEVRALLGDRGLDVALDPVGGRATASCRALLGPLGRLVFYGLSQGIPGLRRSWPRAALAYLRTPRFHPLSLVEPNLGVLGVHLLHLGRKEDVLPGAFGSVAEGLEAGRYRPVVDRTFPLDRDGAVAAHRYVHGRASMGKVVLAAEDADPTSAPPG